MFKRLLIAVFLTGMPVSDVLAAERHPIVNPIAVLEKESSTYPVYQVSPGFGPQDAIAAYCAALDFKAKECGVRSLNLQSTCFVGGNRVAVAFTTTDWMKEKLSSLPSIQCTALPLPALKPGQPRSDPDPPPAEEAEKPLPSTVDPGAQREATIEAEVKERVAGLTARIKLLTKANDKLTADLAKAKHRAWFVALERFAEAEAVAHQIFTDMMRVVEAETRAAATQAAQQAHTNESATLRKERDDLAEANGTLTAEKAAANKRAIEAEGERDELRDNLAGVTQELEAANATIAGLTQELTNTNAELASTSATAAEAWWESVQASKELARERHFSALLRGALLGNLQVFNQLRAERDRLAYRAKQAEGELDETGIRLEIANARADVAEGERETAQADVTKLTADLARQDEAIEAAHAAELAKAEVAAEIRAAWHELDQLWYADVTAYQLLAEMQKTARAHGELAAANKARQAAEARAMEAEQEVTDLTGELAAANKAGAAAVNEADTLRKERERIRAEADRRVVEAAEKARGAAADELREAVLRIGQFVERLRRAARVDERADLRVLGAEEARDKAWEAWAIVTAERDRLKKALAEVLQVKESELSPDDLRTKYYLAKSESLVICKNLDELEGRIRTERRRADAYQAALDSCEAEGIKQKSGLPGSTSEQVQRAGMVPLDISAHAGTKPPANTSTAKESTRDAAQPLPVWLAEMMDEERWSAYQWDSSHPSFRFRDVPPAYLAASIGGVGLLLALPTLICLLRSRLRRR